MDKLDAVAAVAKYWPQVVVACSVTHRFDPDRPELDHAKIYFTALGDDDERKEVQAGLRSAAPFVRRELGKRLHIRRVPELHFEIDRVHEEAQRIERLLHEALPRDPAPPEDGEASGD